LNPEKEELLALILGQAAEPPASGSVGEAIGARTRTHSAFAQWYAALERFIPTDAEQELTEYCRAAVAGVVVGFGERSLSPFLDAHTAIVPPLLEDIRSVYAQVKASGEAYDRERFLSRAFDYGVHKAYYLDWSLYLSKEMY
jgi:hypothetical protein